MLWKQMITIAAIVATVAAAAIYFPLYHRITALEAQLTPLPSSVTQLTDQINHLKEISFPDQPASVDYVDNLRQTINQTLEELQTKVTPLSETVTSVVSQLQVLQQIPIPNDPASEQEIKQLAQTLKQELVNAIRTNTEHDNQMRLRVEMTYKAVTELLKVVEERQKEVQQLIPVGTVTAYAGEWKEDVRQNFYHMGWLICEGQELVIENYTDLYQAIGHIYGESAPDTFKLPDFRGIFLRGLDLGKQLDPNRALGDYQADSNKQHTHVGKALEAGEHNHTGTIEKAGEHRHRLEATGYWFTSKLRNERRAITGDAEDSQKYWTTGEGEHTHGIQIDASGMHQHELTIESSGDNETRPKNYPVVYLIKF